MEPNSLSWLYPCALAFWGLFCVAAAVFALKLKPELRERIDKLPRAALPGALLGLADLLWCIPNAKPILPESLHAYLLPAAFVLAFLAWVFLDKLLARAFGGFLILLAHYFLKESFADGLPGSAFFAFLCFVAGTAGIFLSGKPHLLRDLLRKLCADVSWRYGMASLAGAFAIAAFATLSLHLLTGPQA